MTDTVKTQTTKAARTRTGKARADRSGTRKTGTAPARRPDGAAAASVEELERQILALRLELARARLEQWAGRLDGLELQYHLGRMEADERLTALLADVRHRIATARARAESRRDAAEEAVEAVAEGVERAFADVREAMLRARAAITR